MIVDAFLLFRKYNIDKTMIAAIYTATAIILYGYNVNNMIGKAIIRLTKARLYQISQNKGFLALFIKSFLL